MFQQGDTLQLPLGSGAADGHASAVRTYRVRVEDVLTTDGEPLCYLCPPDGMGVLIREGRLARLLQRFCCSGVGIGDERLGGGPAGGSRGRGAG